MKGWYRTWCIVCMVLKMSSRRFIFQRELILCWVNLSADGNISINLSSILASVSFSLSVSVQCMNIQIEVIMPPNICALLPGSDGRLYSLPFHPQPSPELPGSFVNTVRAVSTKHPVALLALSSSHVAVYGADPSEEGELLPHQ